MSRDDILSMSDDAPKQNPWQEDRLGFRPFAEQLSKVILSLAIPNGYVIGLHGEWGSGKSTAINFVKAFLDKHNVEAENEAGRIEILDFQPWIVSGHQDLITAFFKVLSEKLPGAKRSGWINRNLRLVRRGADPVLDAMATVAVVIDPSGGVVSKATAKVAGTSLNNAIDRFLEEPSLQAAYNKLHALLQIRRKRFLVVIDDLDRLQKEEIRSIMQMVKTVGRLPNVLYLLSYDRDIVWGALDEGVAAERSGPSFGEKIVQQEIELPRPFRDDLLAILDSEVAFLTGATPNDARWQVMVQNGVRRWMRHPRDVQRLANAVKFSWSALAGEIDPQDLFIMEGVRLFDGRVFDWIRWNRDWFFSEGRFFMADESVRKTELKQLIDRTPEEDRGRVMRLLASLFPSRRKLFENSDFGGENHSDVVRRRGIGCEAGYDAYFILYPSPNEVPKHVLDLFMGKLDDKNFLVELMESYIEKKDRTNLTMVGRLLEELSFRFSGQHRATPTQSLLDALFDVGEKVMAADWEPEVFRASLRSLWAGLIYQILLAWGTAEAGPHLERSFRSAKSLSLCASVFVRCARELGKIPGNSGDPPVVAVEVLDELGKILLPMIEKNAADGKLQCAPRVWDIVVAWKFLSGSPEVRAWLNKNMSESADFMSSITEIFVSYAIGSNPRHYEMTVLPDNDLFDLEVISGAAEKHLKGNELTEDARNRVDVVAKKVERHLAIVREEDARKKESESQEESLQSGKHDT
jgi:predicted KAP-like P-loop ATPase